MSRLAVTLLTPRTPYQTYLEERLQSAAGLGWRMPARDPRASAPRPAHDASQERASAPPLAEPA
jgi:hypothetical protein